MYGYIARQPIFDSSLKIFGYELLFRDGLANYFPAVEGDMATSELISSAFLTSGLQTFTGRKKAFINFTAKLLLARVPFVFPKEITVVEILENIEPDPNIVEACKEIKNKGYVLALDDFSYHPRFEPFVSVASIVKIDFQSNSIENISRAAKRFDSHTKLLLAEKIETQEEFQMAQKMGFELFQGYFFARPVVLSRKKLTTQKTGMLMIMAQMSHPDFELSRIESLISHDVTLSFKLLRYINSAYYRSLEEVTSIRQCIVLLGQKGVQRFIALMAMAKLGEGKPDELVRLSAIRARFCEHLSELPENAIENSAAYFTMGLFSLIDALLDDTMENVMKQLPLSNSIKQALIGSTGPMASVLLLASAYEAGQWDQATHYGAMLGIDESQLPGLYLESISWAQSLTSF